MEQVNRQLDTIDLMIIRERMNQARRAYAISRRALSRANKGYNRERRLDARSPWTKAASAQRAYIFKQLNKARLELIASINDCEASIGRPPTVFRRARRKVA